MTEATITRAMLLVAGVCGIAADPEWMFYLGATLLFVYGLTHHWDKP